MEYKRLYKPTLQNIDNNISIALENIQILNHILNPFCTVYTSDVLNHVQKIKTYTKHGNLIGMIIGIKDLFCYKDHPIQASSNILSSYQSSFNSTVVERILSSDGLIIGHQNCDSFGMGATNENSIYGPVKNFYDITKVSGGSSGGSAVGVQCDMCHVSLGTDTGGSVRQPAAFCGIIGFKPSYGQISRHGVIAHASSFDTVGIMSKDINSIIKVYDTISGQDDYDFSMHISRQKDLLAKSKDILQYNYKNKIKIAYIGDIMALSCLQKEIKKQVKSFLTYLQKQNNCDIEEIHCNFLEDTVPIYITITTTEASSNLARYDGIRYGYNSNQGKNFEECISHNRTYGFNDEVKKRILLGNYIFTLEKNNHFLEKAHILREKIKLTLNDIFTKYDFIVLPTTITTAFKINDKISDDILFWSDVCTFIASIGQNPAISIPYGHDDNSMPIGIQIIGKKYDDSKLLTFIQHILKDEFYL